MVDVAQWFRASPCEGEGRGFNSPHPPRISLSVQVYILSEAEVFSQLVSIGIKHYRLTFLYLKRILSGYGHRIPTYVSWNFGHSNHIIISSG